MKKSFYYLMIGCIGLLLVVGCSEDKTTEPEYNEAEANQLAQEGFEILNDKILEIEEIDPDELESGEDVFSEADYNQIKGKFNEALDNHPDNALAHLGMAILEIASINYDNELWDMFHDFDNEFGEGKVFNNQFNLLVKTPKLYMTYLNKSLKDNTISFARIQDFIDNNVLPKLNNTISHLGYAISLADSNVIHIDTGEEIVELDCGEIYIFRASVYAVCAAMKMITLYDVDLFDENGTYDWIHDIEDDGYYYGCDTFYVKIIDDEKWLYLEYHEDLSEAKNDSLFAHIMKYNLEERTDFLKFRAGNTPSAIKSDLEHILEDLQKAVDYIFAETDDQTDDILKLEYLTELNDEISEHDPDAPNFTQDWDTINDVIDWVESLLSSPYTFEENDVTFTVDISRLFNPGLPDLKDYLPFHNWHPESSWITEWIDWEYEWYNGGWSHSFWCKGEFITIENVDYVHETYYDYDVEPLELVDGSGVPIAEDEMPYFPDYTLNGLFPDMNRDKWEELFGD